MTAQRTGAELVCGFADLARSISLIGMLPHTTGVLCLFICLIDFLFLIRDGLRLWFFLHNILLRVLLLLKLPLLNTPKASPLKTLRGYALETSLHSIILPTFVAG